MTPRLKLAMEHDGPSRGRFVRDVVQQLLKLRAVHGALLVASDGFVIAAEVPNTVAIEPLAAMAARLGRDLESSAAKMGHASFSTAMFSGPDGPMFLAVAPIGFVVVLAEPRANHEAIRNATDEAVALLQSAWTD